jgi:membrane protease YdiL (CAAX protease family)
MTLDNPPRARHIPPRWRFAVPAAVRWGVSDVGLAIGALVLSLVAGVVLAVPGIRYSPDAAQFVVGMAGYVLIVVVIVRASYRRGQRSLAKDFGLAFRPVDVLIGIGVGLGARVLSVLYVLGAVAATGHTPAAGNLTLSTEPVWIVLNGFLLASFVAPLVEELLVRGLVLQSVRNIVLRWRNREQPAEVAQQKRAVWISVIVSALVFTALHGGQSTDATLVIALGLSTLTLGFVNAWLVYLTGRLGAPIIAHMTFNGSSVLLAVLAGGLLAV